MEPLTFIGPSVYLLALACVPSRFAIPKYAHVGVGLLLAAANMGINGFWPAALSCVAAFVLFVLLVLFGHLSSRATFGLAVAATGIPIIGWLAFIPGLAIAGIVSTLKLRRTAGKGYVTTVSAETFAAVGVMSSRSIGPIPVPEPSRLPVPDKTTISDTPIGRAHRQTVNLVAYLGIGIALTAAGVSLIAR